MGAFERMFPNLRDTRSNVREEIMSVLFCANRPLSVKMIRVVLKDRHNWTISMQTIYKFVWELVKEGKMAYVGKRIFDNKEYDAFDITEGERDVRRRGCAPNSVQRQGPVHERTGGSA